MTDDPPVSSESPGDDAGTHDDESTDDEQYTEQPQTESGVEFNVTIGEAPPTREDIKQVARNAVVEANRVERVSQGGGGDGEDRPEGEDTNTHNVKDADERSATKAEYKTVAGVRFRGKQPGELDESEIPNDDYEDHYLYPADTKTDSSYAVVSGDGYLKKENVSNAWDLRGHHDDKEDIESKLRQLNREWPKDERPIDMEDNDDEKTATDTDGIQYREKNVEFRAADPERRVVFGAVLVPSALDHQGDFFRESTIHSLSDDFMESVADPDADPAGEIEYPTESGVGGVLHAVFPQDHLSLAENSILDEERRVGTGPAARTFEKGTWLQGWRVTDDDLWELIAEKDILSGFSIGMWVSDWEEYEPGDLPDDIRVPEAVQEDLAEYDLTIDEVFTGEVTDGEVHEVSVVDRPAVPEALHVAHKSQDGGEWKTSSEPGALEASRESAGSHALAKAAGELTESHESCVEYLVNHRGHSEEDAEVLASYLQRVVDGDGNNAGSPDQKSAGGLFGRAKSLVGLSGGEPSTDVESGSGDAADTEATNLGGVTIENSGDGATEKAGRTLSERNQRRMMVAHDLTLSVLEDAGVAGQRRSFTDDPTNDLDIDVGAILDGAMKEDQERAGPAEGGGSDGGSDGGGGGGETGDADTKADGHSAEPTGAAADADSPRTAVDTTLPMQEDELEERFDTIESTLSDLAETVDKVADSDEAAEKDEDDDSEDLSQQELAEQTADLVFERLEESDELGTAGDGADEADGGPSQEDLAKMVTQLHENQQELNASLADVVETTSAIASADGVSQQTTDKSLPAGGEETNSGSEKASFLLGSDS